jgi:putative transposase
MIRTMLEYKAPWYGSRIIVVDPAETSQCCHACGTVDAASRISRSRFVRTSCGSIFDADVNAAKNNLKLGISPTGGFSGDGLRIEPDDRPEAGRTRPQGRKLGPSGPRVITDSYQ